MANGPLSKKARLDLEEHPAVTRFREYLRIETVHPNPDYDGAVKFLHQQAIDIDLDYQCIEVASDRPVVIMTWKGSDPNLSTIMLGSHIDVVPVYPDQWSSPPFAAEKRDNGDIVARGSQDMKCVGMQYLEAIRQLKKTGFKPQRTIHVTFVPEEELGGLLGMKLFIEREEFKKLNVGFGLDEGLANPTKKFIVYYNERASCAFKVVCQGNPGHGSRFIENTAGEKIMKITNHILEYRESQKQKLKSDPSLKLGDVTSINLTLLEGGVQFNVVPSKLSATFDIRVTPTDSVHDIIETLKRWVNEAGSDCSIEWIFKSSPTPPTSTDPSDPWWNAFSTTCKELDMEIELEIFSAATDGRYLRSIGIPVLGFSPMNETPVLLHDHDEYLNENIYLKGIDIYTKIIQALSNVPNTE